MTPPKRGIALTVDYEIFGNGGGDVRTHITQPTARMAAICDKVGAPLTVYFEVEEYLAFVRERARLMAMLGYDPAEEIRVQIIDLARRGHDIQLHLHPEWVDAKLAADGTWHINIEKRTVDSLFDTGDEVASYICSRKQVIEALLAEAGSPQRVVAYRAGAFCAQPGNKLLHALDQNGFLIDSSVVKGMHRSDQHVAYDFTGAPQYARHWRVRDDVARSDSRGTIHEVPIYSRMTRRFQQLTPKRLAAKFSRHVPRTRQLEMIDRLAVRKTPLSLARFLMQRFPTKLDFHNMNASQMLRWIRNAPPCPAKERDVLVLIGHTKEHRDDADFERLLRAIARDPSLEIISLSELGRRLMELPDRVDSASACG